MTRLKLFLPLILVALFGMSISAFSSGPTVTLNPIVEATKEITLSVDQAQSLWTLATNLNVLANQRGELDRKIDILQKVDGPALLDAIYKANGVTPETHDLDMKTMKLIPKKKADVPAPKPEDPTAPSKGPAD